MIFPRGLNIRQSFNKFCNNFSQRYSCPPLSNFNCQCDINIESMPDGPDDPESFLPPSGLIFLSQQYPLELNKIQTQANYLHPCLLLQDASTLVSFLSRHYLSHLYPMTSKYKSFPLTNLTDRRFDFSATNHTRENCVIFFLVQSTLLLRHLSFSAHVGTPTKHVKFSLIVFSQSLFDSPSYIHRPLYV